MHADLSFRLQGVKPILADHGYSLFAAVSRCVPAIHSANNVGIHPIRGRQTGGRRLMLTTWSSLTIRCADSEIPSLLELAGKSLQLDGAKLRVGIPAVHPLQPAANLRSRVVIIKVANTGANELTEDRFLASAQKQLDLLADAHGATIKVGRRRTISLKSRELVGFELTVDGLTEAQSLAVQVNGLGGKRHMGCGIFVPATSANRGDIG